MADANPTPVNSNRLIIDAMGALTSQIQRLNEHMINTEALSARSTVQGALDTSTASKTPGKGNSLPPAWTAQAGVGSELGSQASLAGAAQSAQAQLASSSGSGTDASTPPDGTDNRDLGAHGATGRDLLSLALLGESPLGRTKVGQGYFQYQMMQRNLDLATGQLAPALSGYLDNKYQGDGTSPMAGRVQQASSFITNNQGKIATGLLAVGTARHIYSDIASSAEGWQQAGAQLGYGTTDNRFIAGHLNPFAQQEATRQGIGLKSEETTLSGRNLLTGQLGAGLSKQQATDVVSILAEQGFSNQTTGAYGNNVSGDNMNIAQRMMQPLVSMGLSPADAAGWTTALRYGSTSIQAMTDTLKQVPDAAKQAKETVGDMNASLQALAETQISQGGTQGQAGQTGLDFTQATSLNPQVLGTISQNKMYQAIMMAQNGILPSGIADLSGGSQVQGAMSTFQLLRGAFQGLNQNKYMNAPAGRVQTAQGWQLQDSQIAQMMGISRQEADRLRNIAPHAQQVGQVQTMLGSENENLKGTLWGTLRHANSWQGLSAQDKAQAQKEWQLNIAPQLSHLGLTHQQLTQLQKTPDLRKRAAELQKDLSVQGQNDPNNQIKLNVKFTGAAAKIFQQDGPSFYKKAANAGGSALNSAANNILPPAVGGAYQMRGH